MKKEQFSNFYAYATKAWELANKAEKAFVPEKLICECRDVALNHSKDPAKNLTVFRIFLGLLISGMDPSIVLRASLSENKYQIFSIMGYAMKPLVPFPLHTELCEIFRLYAKTFRLRGKEIDEEIQRSYSGKTILKFAAA